MLIYRLRRYLTASEPLLHVVLAGGLGVALGIGTVLLTPQTMLIGLALVFGGYLVLKRPELGILGILFLTSTIYDDHKLPTIEVGPGQLNLTDPVLFVLLGLIVLRALIERDFKLVRTPLDAPLWFFYGAGLVSTFVALFLTFEGFSMDRFSLAIPEIRIITYYLVFFLVTNLIRNESQLMLLLFGFYGLGTFVAVAMVAQFVLGDAVEILPGRVEELSTQNVAYAGVTRILPPGESLILIVFLASTIMLILETSPLLQLILLVPSGLTGAAVLLTFNRSFWLAVTIGLALLAYLVRGRDRQKLLMMGIAVGLAAIFVLVFFVFPYPESQMYKLIMASVARFDTVLGDKVLEDPSLRWRDTEYLYAIPQILAHPVLGLGLGARYRDYDSRLDWEGGFDGRAYIHNGHLWVMLKTGLLGYAGLAWLGVLLLYHGFKHWRAVENPHLKSVVLGITLTYLTMLPANIVNPMYLQSWWTPALGLMFGIQALILKWHADGRLKGEWNFG
ncbi:MAG: O-antigen ligase family protein [Anaerolineae bacterium]|nr:O-antigen ligase family protein [Anaerolineae bacterium]